MKLFKRLHMRVQSLITAAMICFMFAAVTVPAAAAEPNDESDKWVEIYSENFDDWSTEEIFAEEGGRMTLLGDKSLEIGSPTEGSDSKAIKFIGNAPSAASGGILDLGQDLTAGRKYRFKFSLYLDNVTENPGSMPVIGLEASDPEVSNYVALGCIVNGNVRRANIGNNSGVLGKAEAGSWVEYETVVDMAKKTITYKVTQGDNTIADGSKAYALSDRSVTSAWTDALSFSGISVRTKNGKDGNGVSDKPFYFDNLVVEEYADEIEIFSDNFETDGKYYTNPPAGVTTYEPAPVESSHGNSLGLSYSGSGESAPAVALPLPSNCSYTTGRYKVTFSVLPNNQPTLVYGGSSDGTYFLLGFIASDGSVRHAPIDKPDSYFTHVDTNKWVDFETIVDLDSKTLSYSVSQDGKELAFLSGTEIKKGDGTPIENPIFERFRFVLNTTPEPGSTIYLDDLKVETYNDAVPKLSNARVSISDALGTTVKAEEGLTVSPALTKITLNFGCEMDESTLSNITVVENGSSGNAAAFSAEPAENGAYKLMFTEGYLKENTNYTITVPESVKSADGKAVNEAYVLNFGTSESYAKITKATNESGESFKKADLNAGAQLNVNIEAVNATGADMGLKVIAAYYKDDALVAEDINDKLTSAANNSVVRGDSGTANFIVPDAAADADNVRVYLWNDLDGMEPYCTPWTPAE